MSYEDNIEFQCGKGGGWNLIDNFSGESVEDNGFVLGDLIIGMIAETDQAKGVEVILAKETERRMKMCPVTFGLQESLR